MHVRGFLPALHSVKGDLEVNSILISIVTHRVWPLAKNERSWPLDQPSKKKLDGASFSLHGRDIMDKQAKFRAKKRKIYFIFF